MEEKYPKRLRKITTEDGGISLRFQKTTTGWTKYKPLLYYILDNSTYEDVIKDAKIKLRNTVNQMSTAFENCDLTYLPSTLEEYDNNVKKHYQEYLDTISIWNKIKNNIQGD